MEDGGINRNGQRRQRGSTRHWQTSVCPWTGPPPPRVLPWALAAVTKSRACCQGTRTVSHFGDEPPLQGPWAEQPPWPAAALHAPPHTHTRGGMSLDPHALSIWTQERRGPTPKQVSSSTPRQRPLSQRLDLNFPLQGMFRSSPAEGQRFPPSGWQLLSPLHCPPRCPAGADPVHSPISGPRYRQPGRGWVQPG